MSKRASYNYLPARNCSSLDNQATNEQQALYLPSMVVNCCKRLVGWLTGPALSSNHCHKLRKCIMKVIVLSFPSRSFRLSFTQHKELVRLLALSLARWILHFSLEHEQTLLEATTEREKKKHRRDTIVARTKAGKIGEVRAYVCVCVCMYWEHTQITHHYALL